MEQTGLIVGILGGILGAVGVVASIILGTIAYRRAHKQDIASDASVEATLKVDINYIKEGIDDIKTEQHDMVNNLSRLTERVTRVEESVKSAHKRLDQHLGIRSEEDCKTHCSDK
jgi:peptidoglycan hydrolase CwlO-like protein